MPAIHDIDREAKLILTTWDGDATDAEFIEALANYQRNIQSNRDYLAFNELVNLSTVTRFKLTATGIKRIGRIASKTDQGRIASKTDQGRANGKLAIIVSSDFAYGLARMYETYRRIANTSSKTVRVFREETAAREWAAQTSLVHEPVAPSSPDSPAASRRP